jgi:hypothetical protein
MFENRVLRRIFGPKREMWQEGGESFVIMILICTPNQIITVIKPRRVRWTDHVASKRELN